MTFEEKFQLENDVEIAEMATNKQLQQLSQTWFEQANQFKYSYHFKYLGRPIIQYPQDIMAVQEIIWEVKPDLIIETGVAHGGSLILSASMLALLDLFDGMSRGGQINPKVSDRKVLGIDIEIRPHNRNAIEAHPLSSRIELLEGSSVDENIIDSVTKISKNFKKILVLLDSNHTFDHVFKELQAYSRLVTLGSYCVVFDTVIENLNYDHFPNREWGLGNNPMTAVQEFLKLNDNFIVDKSIEDKLLITVSPNGYLKRIMI